VFTAKGTYLHCKTHGFATAGARFFVQITVEGIVLMRCENCGKIMVVKGARMRESKGVLGKWNFLTELEPGDSLVATNKYEKDSIRSALRYRKMKYKLRREPDKSGWRIFVEQNTAGQL
jgi:hypothetical protein